MLTPPPLWNMFLFHKIQHEVSITLLELVMPTVKVNMENYYWAIRQTSEKKPITEKKIIQFIHIRLWYFYFFVNILYTNRWSCDNASERMLLSQAGNAYRSAKLNVRQTSTIPLSPPVIKYSPSRLRSKHWKL